MDGDSPYPAWKQDPHATESPASKAAPPKPKTSPAPYAGPAPEDSGHAWTIWDGGPAVVVSGGSVSVNTSDLDSLANSLTSSLSGLYTKEDIQEAIRICGLAPDVRGERLGIPEFAALSKALRAQPQ